MSKVPTCYEVIGELGVAMRECLRPEQTYFVLGGIATSAMKHPDSAFDHASRVVFASADAAEPIVRENGTIRDIDILIDSVLGDEEAKRIKTTVADAVPELEVSVFGFEPHMPITRPGQRAKKAVKEWISRRTIDKTGQIRYELYPLGQEVQSESFAPWKLVADEGTVINVLNPAGHMLAYMMRSISGIRYKDAAKLRELSTSVLAEPEFEAEIREGMYKEWHDFATAISALRDGESVSDEVFLHNETRRIDRAAFRAKSRALRYLESKESLIEFAQSGSGARMLKPFVGNK